jgi:hypothetical protein
MSLILSEYIIKYGYIGIFLLVFLQEIGVPNPVPNELVLLFSGYLTSVEKLDFITVLITAVAADTIGSSLLYMTFYCFGQRVLQKWSHVIPTSKLAYLTARVSHQDRWSICEARHRSFDRYCGLLLQSLQCLRVIQFSTEPLTGCISGVIKRFDPREGSPGKACPHTSQNAWMELRRWYHRHVR